MSFDKYFNSIRNHKILTREEEYNASPQKLVETSLKLVVTISHDYKNMGVEFIDLVQEGNIGLIMASEKYKPEKGKFSTFASHYIKMRIRKYLTQNSTIIKESDMHKIYIMKIHKYTTQYKSKYDIEPSMEDIALHLNLSKKIIQNAILHSVKSVTYGDDIDQIFKNKYSKILPSDNLEFSDDIEYLAQLMKSLTTREQLIIKERFFKKKTLKSISEYLGISKMQVKNIQDSSLLKMRKLFS